MGTPRAYRLVGQGTSFVYMHPESHGGTLLSLAKQQASGRSAALALCIGRKQGMRFTKMRLELRNTGHKKSGFDSS